MSRTFDTRSNAKGSSTAGSWADYGTHDRITMMPAREETEYQDIAGQQAAALKAGRTRGSRRRRSDRHFNF